MAAVVTARNVKCLKDQGQLNPISRHLNTIHLDKMENQPGLPAFPQALWASLWSHCNY